MKWLRLYSDIIDDPKILRLSPEIRWFYVGILAISSRNSVPGMLPDQGDIAIHLRVSESKCDKIIAILIDAGLIDIACDPPELSIHGWDKRQFPSDNVTERTRKYRERSENSNGEHRKNVPGNVPRTFRERPRTDTEQIQNRAEAPYPPTGGSGATPLPENSPPDEFPEFPEEATSMFMIMPGEHSLQEIEARELWGDLWRAWKDRRLCFGFYEHQQWASFDSWKHAIKSALKRGVTPGSIRYLEKIAMDADINGIKTDKPVKKADLGPVAYVPRVIPATPARSNTPAAPIYAPGEVAKLFGLKGHDS